MSKIKPLEGLRVVELGVLIAGPFCGHILADFGAEVIKVELPGQGDPLRVWGQEHSAIKGDRSLWWLTQARNKKSITLNLRDPKGQEIAKQIIAQSDILLENFSPGKLEEWNLGYEDIKKINPNIIMVRVSGYGQTGPYRSRRGFGGGAECIGGLRYITGFPDRPPTRVGISIGDSLAGMFGVIGTLMAIYYRDVKAGEGQIVDVAIYESIFNLMEGMLSEYDKLGVIRERTGTILPKVAPSNIYETKDNKYIYIGANHDSLFDKLTKLMGRPSLANDSRYATHNARGERQGELDKMITQWTKQFTVDELKIMLEKADIPSSLIYNIADIYSDPHYLNREMIKEIVDPAWGKVKVPGVAPKLSKTPGDIMWPGPELGEHNQEIYKDFLGLSDEEIKGLYRKQII